MATGAKVYATRPDDFVESRTAAVKKRCAYS